VQAHALDVLVGGQAVLPVRTGTLDAQIMPGELAAGLPSSLLTSRPDIIAAEYQLKAAHAQIGVARAAFLPRIALTSSYGTASAELDGLFKAGSQSWSFSPSLSVPLFDHERNQSNLNVAQARRDIAVAQYEKTIQGAFKDVADCLSARVWLQQQLEIADATLASQLERARLAQLRFDNGATGYLDVLDAQRDLLTAQQQWVQSKRAVQANRVNLFAALGGGGMRMDTRAAAQWLDTPHQ
jgi:multidrug efflux system outer membrane protein